MPSNAISLDSQVPILLFAVPKTNHEIGGHRLFVDPTITGAKVSSAPSWLVDRQIRWQSQLSKRAVHFTCHAVDCRPGQTLVIFGTKDNVGQVIPNLWRESRF